jgi:hypothetical protein
MSESKWVSVFQSSQEFSAHIKKALLEGQGIQVRFEDRRDSSYVNFGYVYLLVPEESVEIAQSILTENE